VPESLRSMALKGQAYYNGSQTDRKRSAA
jgi:hypothetical protein